MNARILVAAAAALSVAGVALAADPDSGGDNARRNCFRSRDWVSWRGADANTIFLRVRGRQFFRIDLRGGSNMVTDRSNHLKRTSRGSGWICNPQDLNLRISDGRITQPLFVRAITKLTPEEVAAIPSHARP